MTFSIFADWAVQTGLAVTLLIALVLLIRRPFARLFGAGAAYSLWSLPVLRIFLPEFNLTLPQGIADKFTMAMSKDISETVTYVISVLPPTTETFQTAPVQTFDLPWSQIGLTLWISGALLWVAYHLVQHIKMKHALTQNSAALPSALEPITYQAKRQLGMKRTVNIRLSNQQTGPLVLGAFRPLIILPKGFMSDYSRKQQHYALTHELAHIKRGDLWVATLALVFRGLNWLNPLIHFAAQKFRTDQEAACDAYVLARLGGTHDIREGYADTLVHAAKHTLKLTPTPLGLTIYHPLKERLMTMKTSNTKPGFASRALASACLGSVLALTAPYNVATADDEKMAGEAHATVKVHNKMKGKHVMKWVEETDGVRSEKHYEIISEDGAKKAYKISRDGTRTEVPLSEVEALQSQAGMPSIPHTPDMPGFGEDVDVVIMKGADGEEKIVKKRVKVIRNGQHIDMSHGPHTDGHKKVIVKKMKDGQPSENTQVFAFSSDDNITIDIEGDDYAYAHGGTHSKMMVDVAADMLKNVKDDDLSDKAKRKLEKARKAIKEAQEALDSEK